MQILQMVIIATFLPLANPGIALRPAWLSMFF